MPRDVLINTVCTGTSDVCAFAHINVCGCAAGWVLLEGIMVRRARKGECFKGILMGPNFRGKGWKGGIMTFRTDSVLLDGVLLAPQTLTHPHPTRLQVCTKRHSGPPPSPGACAQRQHSVPDTARPEQASDGGVCAPPRCGCLSHPGHPDCDPRVPAPVPGPALELL